MLPIKANFVLGCLPNLWLHHEIEKKEKKEKFREIVGSDVVSCKTIPSNIFLFLRANFCYLVTKKFELCWRIMVFSGNLVNFSNKLEYFAIILKPQYSIKKRKQNKKKHCIGS